LKGSVLTTRRKYFVVALLYFSEGLPFGLINNLLSVYFRVKGISLEEIGLLSLLGLAWSLKILWAPLVDRFGRRYFWILPAQLLLALFSAVLALFDPVSQKALFWLALAGICLASATQDIAADAYTIDILEEKELGPANGIRSAAYRVALITAGGVLVMLSETMGWSLTFIAAGVIMVVLALAVISLPSFRQKRPAVSASLPLWEQYVDPIKRLFLKPNFWTAVIFILFFKVGEAMLVAMANPFWIDRGFTPGEIGYIFASLPLAPRFSIYFAALLESLAIGLATAAFLSFLMKLCDKKFSATHYAFLSILFGLGRSLAGVLGGYSASFLGYPVFFLVTFIIGLAPLPLIFHLQPTLSNHQ
jgi:PAT family beta-lactamase induction signal transducer AmpG